MLLVTEVEGPGSVAPGSLATYRCTRFNEPDPGAETLAGVNWQIVHEGRAVAIFPARGPVLEFAPMSDLAHAEIFVRPYCNSPTDKVQAVTRVIEAPATTRAAPAPSAPRAPAAPPTAVPHAAEPHAAEPTPAPGPTPAREPAPTAQTAPHAVELSLDGDRLYASIDGQPRFFVGREVTYLGRRGLMNLERPDDACFSADAVRGTLGHWADILGPVADCESGGAFTCLNTYDRAAFTFGFMQWAANTPDANLAVLLRRLLALPAAPRYFPDLALHDGRIAYRGPDGLYPLESSSSTADLMDYLNATPDSVDRREAANAAKLIHWTRHDPAAREAQVRFAVDQAKSAVADYARAYDLNGQSDEVVLVVFDIRHQGRASSQRIREALRASDPLEALLQIGADRYPQRIETLRGAIQRYRAQGLLGRAVYDAASATWCGS